MILDEILNTFENEKYRKVAEKWAENAPDYWHKVPASSSGKYHPSYALGDGGLVRHTTALIRILNHMMSVESVENQYTSRERDLLRLAGLVHDMWKSGTQEDYEKSKYTRFNHPLIAAEHVRNMNDLPKDDLEFIAHAVEAHMGQWCEDKRNPDVVLPKPNDKYQIILHLADYLASRKDIEMKFDEPLPDVDTWRIPFGRHNGKTIAEIYAEDPGYIDWAKKNMEKEPAATLFKNFEIKV